LRINFINAAVGAFVIVLIAACSENLGPAPPDGGRVVGVRTESVSGPRTPRLGTVLGSGGGAVFVGTDAGLFRFAHPASWSPVHGGFLNAENVSRAGVVEELALDRGGRRVFFRGVIGPSQVLVASVDGGHVFSRLERPDALLTEVDRLGIAPAGDLGPDGAWLVVQGGRTFSRSIAVENWNEYVMPAAPLAVSHVAASADGWIGVAVAHPGESDWTFWSGRADAGQLDVTGTVLESRPLAMIWSSGELVAATASGVGTATTPLVRWPGAVIEHADLVDLDGQLEWALVGRLSDGSLALASGSGAGEVAGRRALDFEDVVGVTRTGSGAIVLRADASVSDGLAQHPYGGTEVDLFSVASRPGSDRYAAGHTRTGEIYQGRVADPLDFATRGTPLRASAPRRIIFDPAVEDALFVGSFGVYRSDPLSASWQERNTGFFSYDPGYFAGPFPVSAFDVVGSGEFWVGGTNGDGPYRSVNAGTNWERVHEGLGEPGSYLAEPGLPLVTQVQAFTTGGDGAIWMGGFRGGVFRLEPGTDLWEQRSAGLPRIDGVPHEGCCPVPGVSEVDVRDLVALDDGSLLAATGWGVYRLPRDAERWELRSTGLFNRDVTRLLRHPSDGSTVVAGARGRPEAPDWLFVSEDAGRTWFAVASRLLARTAVDLAWSDPAALELVVLLEAQGLWRMELDP
jgi:hypothetical protein